MAGFYSVEEGDCITSIAYDRGFFWETLWNHPNNADLKAKRVDPNILLEGDQLFIPDLSVKIESRGTAQRHRFKLKEVPAKLRLRIVEDPPPPQPTVIQPAPPENVLNPVLEDPVVDLPPEPDRPRANVPFILEINDQVVLKASTDSDGKIECSIPPNARTGRLILSHDTADRMVILLRLGRLDPISEVRGVKQRLFNLSYDCGDTTGDPTPGFAAALSAFQQDNGLQDTGDADQATRDKLVQLHGG